MSNSDPITWDIYEIHTKQTEIHGVMLRGRIRKLGLENGLYVSTSYVDLWGSLK